MKKEKLIELIPIRSIILFIAIFALFSTFVIQYIIKNKATPQDYKPLYEQAKVIENNFESLKTMDNVRGVFFDNYKVITLESEKCNLILHFDNDFSKIIKYEEEKNKFKSIGFVLAASFMLSALFTFHINNILHYFSKKIE